MAVNWHVAVGLSIFLAFLRHVDVVLVKVLMSNHYNFNIYSCDIFYFLDLGSYEQFFSGIINFEIK